jgi:hypothetical protein
MYFGLANIARALQQDYILLSYLQDKRGYTSKPRMDKTAMIRQLEMATRRPQ